MAEDRLARYVWILDTVRRYGRITKRELDCRWDETGFSDGGGGIPRRTFHKYRNSIEELFGVNIECDRRTFEYYIAEQDAERAEVTEWMFNNAAVNNVIADSGVVSDRIIVEDVPSAREYLATVTDAIKGNRCISFTYSSYSRIAPREGIVLEPYFLKIFRQRWYVTGHEPGAKGLRTYALDRMSDAVVLTREFTMPENFNARRYTRDSFGIVFDMGEVTDVRLAVSSRRAKYLRALPLHHSQKELVGDDGNSVFTYRIKPTPDFVEEILSMGPDVVVEAPQALRDEVKERLRMTLEGYS